MYLFILTGLNPVQSCECASGLKMHNMWYFFLWKIITELNLTGINLRKTRSESYLRKKSWSVYEKAPGHDHRTGSKALVFIGGVGDAFGTCAPPTNGRKKGIHQDQLKRFVLGHSFDLKKNAIFFFFFSSENKHFIYWQIIVYMFDIRNFFPYCMNTWLYVNCTSKVQICSREGARSLHVQWCNLLNFAVFLLQKSVPWRSSFILKFDFAKPWNIHIH